MENGGDNPPPYDYDIINNQLIDTFGTTTAPEDYVFGSVNVQPRANFHSEHTFNTTDLTQQQIENAAILDSDGTIHELGINQPQNHEQGAIINESALTILKWGKYNLKTVGLHQIATATNTNHWVIPAVMSVEINLASNQVLTNNGIYNVIQGQNGLEFQRVQQQSRGLPDPTGTSIGQFNVNIPTTKVNIKQIKLGGTALNFIKNNTGNTINLNYSQIQGMDFIILTDNTDYYGFYIYNNYSQTASTTPSISNGSYYSIVNRGTYGENYIDIYDENNNEIFYTIYANVTNNHQSDLVSRFYKNVFNLNIPYTNYQ